MWLPNRRHYKSSIRRNRLQGKEQFVCIFVFNLNSIVAYKTDFLLRANAYGQFGSVEKPRCLHAWEAQGTATF